MSKAKDPEQQQVVSGSPADNQPAFMKELQENGTAILTASTREALAEMVNDIPADIKYAAGAIGRSRDTGEYSLRIDLI